MQMNTTSHALLGQRHNNALKQWRKERVDYISQLPFDMCEPLHVFCELLYCLHAIDHLNMEGLCYARGGCN